MMMNIYVAAAVTIGIMLIAYAIDISWLSAMATVALFLIALIALIITFVGVIANFYKTLYGQQGYLSFTLPVTSGQLLAAKAIVAFLWMIVSYAVSIGIMIWIYDYVTSLIGENNLNMIKTIISMFRSMPGAKAIKGNDDGHIVRQQEVTDLSDNEYRKENDYRACRAELLHNAGVRESY